VSDVPKRISSSRPIRGVTGGYTTKPQSRWRASSRVWFVAMEVVLAVGGDVEKEEQHRWEKQHTGVRTKEVADSLVHGLPART
jgi:hypothetical protein